MVKPVTDPSRRTGLGPRGQGLFERLFGARQPAPAEAPLREARSIAVASGKGGTGKSFLATSLAVVLHQQKIKTSLIDCDFGLACDHLLLGVQPKVHLQHLLAGQTTLDELKVVTPAGPTLIPGVTGMRQMTNLTNAELRAFGESLASLAATEDTLIFDMGAGITTQTILTLSSAEYVLLVVQPEIAAMTDAYAIVKCVAQLNNGPKLGVVVNRVENAEHGQATFDKLAQVSGRFTGIELESLGAITEEPAVTHRRIGQLPLVATEPDCRTAHEVRSVIDAIRKSLGGLEPRTVPADAGIMARFQDHQMVF